MVPVDHSWLGWAVFPISEFLITIKLKEAPERCYASILIIMLIMIEVQINTNKNAFKTINYSIVSSKPSKTTCPFYIIQQQQQMYSMREYLYLTITVNELIFSICHEFIDLVVSFERITYHITSHRITTLPHNHIIQTN